VLYPRPRNNNREGIPFQHTTAHFSRAFVARRVLLCGCCVCGLVFCTLHTRINLRSGRSLLPVLLLSRGSTLYITTSTNSRKRQPGYTLVCSSCWFRWIIYLNARGYALTFHDSKELSKVKNTQPSSDGRLSFPPITIIMPSSIYLVAVPALLNTIYRCICGE
jgi:hypothetical protein